MTDDDINRLSAVHGGDVRGFARVLLAIGFEKGWRMAVAWAGDRDDLLADVDSPAYRRDRDAALTEPVERTLFDR